MDCYLLEWIKTARKHNCPITGPVLQSVAESFAKSQASCDFVGSNGWLEAFHKRNEIVSKRFQGER